MFRVLQFVILFLIATARLYAQDEFLLEAKILNQNTKEPVANATVTIGKVVTVSDNKGFFSIRFKSYKQKIEIRHLAYLSLTTIIPSALNHAEFLLQPITNSIEEVTVFKDDKTITKSVGGIHTLTRKDLENTPGFLGQKDPVKAIQSLPGVGKGGEGNSGIYIRGGSSGENLTLLNDAVIYNPSHLLGLFSVFNSSVADEIILHKTGVTAMHSGRISSLIEINSSSLVEDSLRFEIEASQFSLNTKAIVPVTGNWSVGIFGRKTFLNQTVWPLLNKISSSSFFQKIDYDFYDLNFISNSRLGNKNTLQLSAFTGGDDFGFGLKRFDIKNNMAWNNVALSGNWKSVLSENLTLTTIVSYSSYKFDFSMQQDDYDVGINSKIKDYNFKSYVALYLGKHQFKAGIQFIDHQFTPNTPFAQSLGTQLDYGTPNVYYADERSVFINDEINLSEKTTLFARLRLNYFRHKGPYTQIREDNSEILYQKNKTLSDFLFIEPSVSVNYTLTANSAIKAVLSHNVQPIHLISITAVNFPADFWMPAVNDISPSKSYQGSIGYFRDWDDKKFNFYIDLYYKEMSGLVEFSGGIINLIDNLRIEDNLLKGKGKAYGAEFFFRKNNGKLNGWMGYTIARSQRDFVDLNNGKTFPFKYDRRHDLSITANYIINKRLNISSSFVYASGNAFTMPVSRYTLGGNVINEYGDYNGGRMPALHRLDLSSTYQLRKRKNFESELSFSIYNVYSRKNPIYKFFLAEGDLSQYKVAIKPQSVSLLPVLPAINYKIKFK